MAFRHACNGKYIEILEGLDRNYTLMGIKDVTHIEIRTENGQLNGNRVFGRGYRDGVVWGP